MNKIRYLTMMVMCLLWHIASYGQDDFNPTSPIEPNAPQIKHKLTLIATPSDGGSVSGGGTYVDGSKVTLRASASSGYAFEAWSDKDGMVIATTASFQYTTKEKHDTLYAHFRFVPTSPTEPADPNTSLYYRLTLEPDQGCTVSGGGRYLMGTRVSVSASLESGYEFINWTDSEGEVVSTSRSFTHTKKDENEVLTAHCRFNPSAPSEPGDPILKHWVRATCFDGGSISGSANTRILEGNTFSLSVSVNTGYEFVGWYLNGELYTTLRSFSSTMGKENLNFEARLRFNPSSPTEPAMPALNLYTYYLMTVNGKPGDTVSYPINLVNTEEIKDINIRLTFPAGMEIDPKDYILSELAQGYTVTISEAQDDISIIEEGAKLWDFTLIGGTTSPATHALLTFKVKIPEDMPTRGKHQVKINQVSMAMPDGTPVTARTRNGRIGVYDWGDSNGDGAVSVADIVTAVAHLNGKTPDEFIEEVTDVDEDGKIDLDDCTDIETIVLTK